jgi:hypothetical protein
MGAKEIDRTLRSRVLRLLRGEVREQDLTSLFLGLRGDRADPLAEIRNFIARPGEPDRGLVSRQARDFFALLRFGFPVETPALDRLPGNIREVLDAGFDAADARAVRITTGLSPRAARRHLDDIKSRLRDDPSGAVHLAWPTDEDLGLINVLAGQLVAKPAFDDVSVFEALRRALLARGLLAPAERRAFAAAAPAVALYVVCRLHDCAVALPDGTIVELHATPDARQGTIGVVARAALKGVIDDGDVMVAAPFFVTSLDAGTYCEAELLPESRLATWPYGLELSVRGRLTRIS